MRIPTIATFCSVAAAAIASVASAPDNAPLSARPLSPASTAFATSSRPLFRWALAGGADGAHVQICRDRACQTTVLAFDAAGGQGSPPSPLPRGVLFWRVFARRGGVTAALPSATWSATIPAHHTATATTWGSVLDVNGDGRADVAVGDATVGQVRLYLGSRDGLARMPSSTLNDPGPPRAGMSFVAIPGQYPTKVTGARGLRGSQFGVVAGTTGDVNGDGYGDLAIGAPGSDGFRGAVYVYFGGPNGLTGSPNITLVGPDPVGTFGESLSAAGDVNGDGYGDLVVGASGVDRQTGRAYLYHGGPNGLAATPAVTLVGRDGCFAETHDATHGQFGQSVAGVGDVNGDGYSDVLVGAPVVGRSTGRAYLYLGGPNALANEPAVTFAPEQAAADFGSSVGPAGDLNGDGYPDLAVGANYSGEVQIVHGGRVIKPRALTLLRGPGMFGGALVGPGDLDGDGYDDLVVAAVSALPAGEVRVYRGGPGFATPAATISAPAYASSFGEFLASPGDVDGDGRPDVLIGARALKDGSGRALVYAGARGGLGPVARLAIRTADGTTELAPSAIAPAEQVADAPVPVIVDVGVPVKDVALGRRLCVLAVDGTVRCTGKIGDPFSDVPLPARAATLVSGLGAACARLDNGETWCWDCPDAGSSSAPPPGTISGPTPLPFKNLKTLSIGFSVACGVEADGNVVCWGDLRWSNGFVPARQGAFVCRPEVWLDKRPAWRPSRIETVPQPVPAVRLAVAPDAISYPEVRRADAHAAPPDLASPAVERLWVLGRDGILRHRGLRLNGWGRVVDVQVAESRERDELPSTGSLHPVRGCALSANGRVGCWGQDRFGQSPRTVRLPGRAAQLALGADHSCARLADATVACWGADPRGALGFVSAEPCPGRCRYATCTVAPVRVPGLASVSVVRTGPEFPPFTCAVAKEGKLLCWGEGYGLTLPGGPAGRRIHMGTPQCEGEIIGL